MGAILINYGEEHLLTRDQYVLSHGGYRESHAYSWSTRSVSEMSEIREETDKGQITKSLLFHAKDCGFYPGFYPGKSLQYFKNRDMA